MAQVTKTGRSVLAFLLHAEAGNGGPALPRNLMVLISLGQGAALLALWRAASDGDWPAQIPTINWPLWTFTIIWPALLLLSIDAGNLVRALTLASGAALAAVLLGIHMGWQASPFGAFPVLSLLAVYVLTMLVASFKTLMYLQQRAAGTPVTYPALFASSWRNFLVTALAAMLTAGVALILMLWGELFRAIGVDFFIDLFSEDWFLFPVLAVAFGLGAFIFRRLTRVIDAIVSLLEGLMRLLLPLLGLVVAIFLATLPFTGLSPLWGTGNGTVLLMALNGLALFAVNAVYQTGERSPYPLAVHRALYGSLALLPIISALALYGLSLRVGQHGWTVARCWAFTVAVLFAAFSLGYAWSIVRRRDAWGGGFAKVNIWMGWAVLAVMVLVNTPLLDFRSLSLGSQLKRVEDGAIELMDLDFAYVEEHLARPGWLRRTALMETHGETDPALAEFIRNPIPSWADNRLWDRLTLRPEPFDIPAGLRTAIARSHPINMDGTLVRVDLDADGRPEYALLFAMSGERQIWGELFRCQDVQAAADGVDEADAPNAGREDADAAPAKGLRGAAVPASEAGAGAAAVSSAGPLASSPGAATPPHAAAAEESSQAKVAGPPSGPAGEEPGCGGDWRSTPLRGDVPAGWDAKALLREGEVGTVAPVFSHLTLGDVVVRTTWW